MEHCGTSDFFHIMVLVVRIEVGVGLWVPTRIGGDTRGSLEDTGVGEHTSDTGGTVSQKICDG